MRASTAAFHAFFSKLLTRANRCRSSSCRRGLDTQRRRAPNITRASSRPSWRAPVLFNLHRALATGASTVVVVEGFFDALAVHRAGYSAVVALIGSTLSQHQAELLYRHFDRVLPMLDGDEAGRLGVSTIAAMLARQMAVMLITLDEGKQPDQLTPDALQGLLSTACTDKVKVEMPH
jgi:DNA primase